MTNWGKLDYYTVENFSTMFQKAIKKFYALNIWLLCSIIIRTYALFLCIYSSDTTKINFAASGVYLCVYIAYKNFKRGTAYVLLND